LHARIPEASRLASEYMAVIESIGDSSLTIGLSLFAIVVKLEAGELTDALRWSQAVIDIAGGDSAIGNFVFGSPLAGAHMLRGVARWTTGSSRWREDLDWAVELAHEADPLSHAAILRFKYAPAIPRGVLLADDAALRDIEAAFKFAERCSDDVALRNTALLRWCLQHQLRVIYMINLMTIGRHQEPRGAFLASVLY
jgi:adenylate cyclase